MPAEKAEVVPLFALAHALFLAPASQAIQYIVIGKCHRALMAHGGLVTPPTPVVGQQARVFTHERKWIAAQVRAVSPGSISFGVGEARFDLRLPQFEHYIDLRDPTRYPEFSHPILRGIHVDARVRIKLESLERELWVTKICLYSGRFLAVPTIPAHLRPPGAVPELLQLLAERAGVTYSIAFDEPTLEVLR